MGREIRMVVPNWEHPKRENGNYHPMFDRSATDAFNEWLEDFESFKKGDLHKYAEEYGYDVNNPYDAFCDWNGGLPDAEYFRPHWNHSEATWIQVYETVSEGTPVTPPFETPEELIEYLVENGDFWDQSRRKDYRYSGMNCDPWKREVAENFVKSGWAPSMVISDGKIKSGVEALAEASNSR